MLLVQTNPALAAPIETELRSHFADGLARLRRTPSGEVRRAGDLLLDNSETWGMEFALRLSRGETSADERVAFGRVPIALVSTLGKAHRLPTTSIDVIVMSFPDHIANDNTMWARRDAYGANPCLRGE